MAKDKKWVDCPICGTDGSMNFQKGKTFEVKKTLIGKVKIENLSGYFCKECKDGFYDSKSQKIINAKLAEIKAIEASKVVTVSEVATLESLANELKTSKQFAHRIMKEGKLPYVIFAGQIHPYQKTLEEAKLRVKLLARKPSLG